MFDELYLPIDDFFGREISNIGVYWDYMNASTKSEGVNVPLAEWILYLARSYGIPYRLNVYSSWNQVPTPVKQGLYSMGFDLKEIPIGKTNSEDAMIIVDALSDAFETDISSYFIITADKDFIPLINKLKKLGKSVYVIGSAPIASELLIQSCDQFLSIEELKKRYHDESQDQEKQTKIRYHHAISCLIDAILQCESEDRPRRYSVIDTFMRANEDYNYYGYRSIDMDPPFNSFSSFIEKAENEGHVKTSSVGNFTEVFTIEENPSDESMYTSTLVDLPSDMRREFAKRVKSVYDEILEDYDWEYVKFGKLTSEVRKKMREDNVLITNSAARLILEDMINRDVIGQDGENKILFYKDHNTRLLKYIS